ncbi:hypothetical protein ACFSKL_12595 [Belliella marina]|uniref:Uncharacterized protein n=1 Tax=Belliella marina TaxID=1644146 RepID=A0ABW4VLS9_9BACT
MKKIMFLTFLVIICSCKGGLEEGEGDALSELTAEGDGGGSIDIDIVTRNDKPAWLGINDEDSLIVILGNLDTLKLADFVWNDISLGNISEDIFRGNGNYVHSKSRINEEISFYKKDSTIFSFNDKGFRGFYIEDIDSMSFKSVKLKDLDIYYFKDNFPRTYSARNFFIDAYKINFIDNLPEEYDRLKFHLEESERILNIRFIDGVVVQLELEDGFL